MAGDEEQWKFRFRVVRARTVGAEEGEAEGEERRWQRMGAEAAAEEEEEQRRPWRRHRMGAKVAAWAKAEAKAVGRAELERALAAGAEVAILRARVTELERALVEERRRRRAAEEEQEGAETRAVAAEERAAEAEERAAEAGANAELWRSVAEVRRERWLRRVAAEKEVEEVRAATAAAVGLIEID